MEMAFHESCWLAPLLRPMGLGVAEGIGHLTAAWRLGRTKGWQI